MSLKDNSVEIGLKIPTWKIANQEVKVLLVTGSNLYSGGLQLVIEQNLKEPGLKFQIVDTIRHEKLVELHRHHELAGYFTSKDINLVLLPVLPDFELTVQTGLTLREAAARVPILWLDIPNDPEKIIRCIQTRANGFIFDNEKPEQFCNYLIQAIKEEVVWPQQSLKYIFDHLSQLDLPGVSQNIPPTPIIASQADLTRREQEVLSAIAANLNNRQIAAKLSIEICTVKNHVHHIMEKLQVNNRQDAIRFCQIRYQKRTIN